MASPGNYIVHDLDGKEDDVPSAHETAYPQLKSHPFPHELAMVYTPSKEEVALAEGATHIEIARVRFLVLLKTF